MSDPEQFAEVGRMVGGADSNRAAFGSACAEAAVDPDSELAPEQLDTVSPFSWAQLGRFRLRVISWATFELN